VIQGQKWPTVSIINGADSAEKEFKRNLEYLESFEKVYICMDRDDPGQHAAISCAKLLSPGKAFIVKMDPELKDPCEYLKQGRSEQFIREWWAAPLYTPAGILSSSTVKERIRNREHAPSVPYPFEGLNSLTYGIRKGEAVIVTADTGVGKTSFLREVQHSILEHDKDAKIGTMYLEETPEDSGLGMMSVSASIPFHLPDAKYTEEEYKEAEKILDEDRVFFYDSFGSNNIDEIISRVRYYARGLGCGYIILDHLSIIVSDHQQGDERKKLDEIMTKLKTLTIELNIALIAAVHVNRSGQIRGTAGIEQLANMVIKLSRDIVNPDPIKRNLVNYLVGKNRFAGKTGPACVCKYDDDTGRTVEVNDETYKVSDEELTKFFNSDTMEAEHG
jgi:twinkle protein